MLRNWKGLINQNKNGGDTVLFHVFNSQEERRAYGGSAFIEFQFCKLPAKRKVNKRVALHSINHWQNDSLYVDDEGLFYKEYHCIFDSLDIFGMNYYGPDLIKPIIEKLITVKPIDYEVLIEWLDKAKEYNGFYILGI